MLRIKNKTASMGAIALSLTLLFTGCGSKTEPTAAGSAPAATKESTAAATPTPAPAKSTEPLTVYLNDFDEIIGPMFEKASGYKLNIVSGNGAEIMSRIEAEKGNPHWDVVWMDAMPSIHQLGKNGQLLEGWSPKNVDGLTDFAKKLIPANKSYYATGAHAASVLIYNTKAIDAAKAPKTWSDLSKPEFKNIVGMADPAVAAPAYPFVAWFFNNQGMDGGKKYFDSVLANGVKVYPKNPNVSTALTGGEIKVAALQESNAYIMKNKKEPVEIVWPEEGAPASVRVAAIQKQTKKMDAAKAFVEFILDPKTQQELIDKGEESYFEPSAKGVTAKKDRAANAKLVVADPEWAASHEAEIKTWFADKAVK
ncbi:extracellular solute-binding protein [Paenibacillus sp. NPDC056579]|uniref:extracellular solute-binding protein n=1 Tax=Paenibacillus sp. NPDC056579 TaxID=3345871 RepID=UPI0036B6781A